MTTFRTRYLTCPHCSCLMYTYKVSSFYISKSICYSDGKSEDIPYFPPNEEVGICSECKKTFWEEDVLLDIDQMEGDYPNKLTVHDLDIALHENSNYEIAIWYFDLLKNEFARTKSQKIYLHFKIWHILNDQIRPLNKTFFYYIKGRNLKKAINVLLPQQRKNKFPEKIQKLFLENLNRLIEIFEITNDEDKLLFAEMHRELGDYAKSLQLLNEIKSENKNRIYRQIEQANKRKNSLVINVNKF